MTCPMAPTSVAAAVADGMARDHTRHPAHFVQEADLRFAGLDDMVQPRVLDHFGHVPAHAAARRKPKKRSWTGPM
jgi:hypothetical protein